MRAGHELTVSVLAGAPLECIKPLFRQAIWVSIDPELRANATYELAFAFATNLLVRMFPLTYSDFSPHLRVGSLLQSPLLANPPSGFEVELVIGRKSQTHARRRIYAWCSDWRVSVEEMPGSPDPGERWNPILAMTTACYAAARVTSLLFGEVIFAVNRLQPFSILDFHEAEAEFDWRQRIDAGLVHIAGIGAIGTAFLFALAAHGQMDGKLVMVDEDLIEDRNLDSYSLFGTEHIGQTKVLIAKRLLDGFGSPCTFEGVPRKLQDFVAQQIMLEPGFKIENLVSAPDRRDTRRQFQGLLPRQVWDASTGPDEVVIHHNDFRPDLACLACIYAEVPDEDAHLRHIAETLNLQLHRVRAGQQISEADAEKIRLRYPKLAWSTLVGRAYDSVFKELCSAGQLHVEDEVVLTPFPFISALAGVLLYFDFVQSLRPDVFGGWQDYNYLRLNPLHQPNSSYRRIRAAREDCPVCRNPVVRRHFDRLWNGM